MLKLILNSFKEDVYRGLTSQPKKLPSKYFYDKKGDKIFQQIMSMPEYYLTNAELEIIQQNTQEIAKLFNSENGFDLIELGAGDGKKTKVLLRYLQQQNYNFSYLPIDISNNALEGLKTSLEKELPKVKVQPQQGMYFEVLNRLASYKDRKKIIMFLGSNIGNLEHHKAIEFMQNIQESMNPNDLLFMGFDQKKDPQKIIDAYSDKAGITEAFNKNLLLRINTELDANFNIENFMHWETYDPETGTAKSFLVSKETQNVNIKKIDLEVHFNAWETIHTEISQKYDKSLINWLADKASLKIEHEFTDTAQLFKNVLFSKK
ncbi:L-histidine N(alpha)-methyltransferase [Joostella sp. CR20]|uniref:L-histidine N(alpha)-methyltransferase n=1 Tax=Joostella sp. CR20 TaxID=2804312 RepID=UPI00313E7A33